MPTFKVTSNYSHSNVLHWKKNSFSNDFLIPFFATQLRSSKFLKYQEYTIP